jgi:hypothetical protein
VTAKAVRAALHSYLLQGVAQGAIPSVSTVNKYQRKITPETELYEEQAPGSPDGAVIFMYIPTKSGRRIALGGAHSGRKARAYELNLICFFRWKGPATEQGDEANEEFQDGLTAWIEADRNAGTQAVSLGGDGTGTIFSWGEGEGGGPTSGGDDLNWRTGMPRTIRGQTSQIFSVLSIHVIEIVAT